jgi:hypothetical protein
MILGQIKAREERKLGDQSNLDTGFSRGPGDGTETHSVVGDEDARGVLNDLSIDVSPGGLGPIQREEPSRSLGRGLHGNLIEEQARGIDQGIEDQDHHRKDYRKLDQGLGPAPGATHQEAPSTGTRSRT